MKKKTFIFTLIITCVLFSATFLMIYGADTFDKYKVYYGNKSTGHSGYYIKGTPYLPVAMIGSYAINPNVLVDTTNMRLTINLSTQNIMMADDATTNFVKSYAGNIYIPLQKIDNMICFPLNATDQFFKLSYSIEGNSIKLRAYSGSDKIAKVNNSFAVATTSLTEASGNQIPLALNERVFITGQTDNYYIIETGDSEKAYLIKDHVTVSDLDLASLDFYAPKKTKWKQGYDKINLAWQYVAQATPESPPKYSGLDIMSPTWFDLITNGDGSVENNGDKGYTDQCHKSGYMVWATITNNMSTTGSTKFTTQTFNDLSLLNKSIAQYIFYSCLYDVDGINIDYEDVSDSDAAGLVNFTKIMRNYTERQGLVLSIDTLIPKPWTIEYDRKQLAKYVDYVAIMTYDEHYSSSPNPGSIASLPWVEQAVKDTIAEGVPSNQILLGVPLYTRVWCIDSAGKIVSNKSASMTYMETAIKEKGLTPTYLPSVGQNYVEYPDGATTAKVWLEDATSIQNRIALVQKYNLAGTACWQFAQGSTDIWNVFNTL